jgi:heat shock protein HslJ
MAVEVRLNTDNRAFLRGGSGYHKDNETVAQDAARATDMAEKTVMYQDPSDRKWYPLTAVTAGTPGRMVCGAYGSTAILTQAVTDGEFAITIDGVSYDITGLDLSVIEAGTDTPATGVCGVNGATMAAYQAITDGSFQVVVNGLDHDITGLNFSDVDSPTDTQATAICGANGANLAAWQAITDGSFQITVNGVPFDITGMDFSSITALDELADVIDTAAAVTGEQFRALYNSKADVVSFVSQKSGQGSTITALTAGSAGTDISGAGFLNGLTGTITLVQGTGGSGHGVTIADVINQHASANHLQFVATYNEVTNVVTFTSLKTGEQSTMAALTAGSAGTDISGAGYLNGLTGTMTLTQGTGGDIWATDMVDVINEAGLGRYTALWDGTKFTFVSNSQGLESSVSVLSAVAGGAGTDISGAGYLNGLTGTGTATAGTAGQFPCGILDKTLATADIVAGDVTGVRIITGGAKMSVAADQVVYENSLTRNSVCASRDKTIEGVLAELGIFLETTVDVTSYENA